ncbi:EPIDERMAL PATTERNING FACTOR-like protein 9 isoform X1 [Camellia sinensis]|uniref:EPIDERMAL PATTERNING FACTOR-like protein 9 isoform X1 n=1 Tax=Camellia sinensis TaxID=4442 RepID=UPI0010360646|nr:EPIDERMAL PATTERNING FACTOR-like protein 9 isoform X1 [Camellia sinensis]
MLYKKLQVHFHLVLCCTNYASHGPSTSLRLLITKMENSPIWTSYRSKWDKFAYMLASPGSRTQVLFSYIRRAHQSSTSEREFLMQDSIKQWMNRNSRRAMIGSTAPTCTYNECRGCKYKCSAEQVPVEGNDPINSAYHYKCVCHR